MKKINICPASLVAGVFQSNNQIAPVDVETAVNETIWWKGDREQNINMCTIIPQELLAGHQGEKHNDSGNMWPLPS